MERRQRCPAEKQGQVSEFLNSCIQSQTRIQYDCSKGGKINVKGLLAHKEILAGLMLIQPNGSFSQTFLESVLMELAVNKVEAGVFSLRPDQISDYASVVAQRLRTMLRFWTQSLRRTPRPKWLANLGPDYASASVPKEEGSPSSEEGEAAATLADDAQGEFFVGWCSEMRQAWRTKHPQALLGRQPPCARLRGGNICWPLRDPCRQPPPPPCEGRGWRQG